MLIIIFQRVLNQKYKEEQPSKHEIIHKHSLEMRAERKTCYKKCIFTLGIFRTYVFLKPQLIKKNQISLS
jgi:hypothetical protein